MSCKDTGKIVHDPEIQCYCRLYATVICTHFHACMGILHGVSLAAQSTKHSTPMQYVSFLNVNSQNVSFVKLKAFREYS